MFNILYADEYVNTFSFTYKGNHKMLCKNKKLYISLLAKISVGFPSQGHPLNCQAGPWTNTATTRSLEKKQANHQWVKQSINTTHEAEIIIMNTLSNKHFWKKFCLQFGEVNPLHLVISFSVFLSQITGAQVHSFDTISFSKRLEVIEDLLPKPPFYG